MTSRRRFLGSLGGAATTLKLIGSAAATTEESKFEKQLDKRGYVEYRPDDLGGKESTPDGEGSAVANVYHKKGLTKRIREKSDGEVNRPGAIMFTQELKGDWQGTWDFDASLGEVPSDTRFEANDTSINFDLIHIELMSNNDVGIDYSKESTTIEKQVVKDGSKNKSLVSKRAIGYILSTYGGILLNCGCIQSRYTAGLWENMVAGSTFGDKYVAHSDPLDYSKGGYSTASRTYNAEWKGAEQHTTESYDSDPFNNHVNIRGYLSIESRGGDRTLGVGGFYLNEDSVEFSKGITSEAELEINEGGLQDDIIQLMMAREL